MSTVAHHVSQQQHRNPKQEACELSGDTGTETVAWCFLSTRQEKDTVFCPLSSPLYLIWCPEVIKSSTCCQSLCSVSSMIITANCMGQFWSDALVFTSMWFPGFISKPNPVSGTSEITDSNYFNNMSQFIVPGNCATCILCGTIIWPAIIHNRVMMKLCVTHV